MGECTFVITINDEAYIIEEGHNNIEVNAIRMALDKWEKRKNEDDEYYRKEDIRDENNVPIFSDRIILDIKVAELKN